LNPLNSNQKGRNNCIIAIIKSEHLDIFNIGKSTEINIRRTAIIPNIDIDFVDNFHIVKDNMFSIPPLFKLIQEQSKTDWKEMYQVFNCGHRMEIYVSPEIAKDIITISKSFNVDAKIVGRVEASSTKKLTIKSEFGVFEY
jgi:hypothetical protein